MRIYGGSCFLILALFFNLSSAKAEPNRFCAALPAAKVDSALNISDSLSETTTVNGCAYEGPPGSRVLVFIDVEDKTGDNLSGFLNDLSSTLDQPTIGIGEQGFWWIDTSQSKTYYSIEFDDRNKVVFINVASDEGLLDKERLFSLGKLVAGAVERTM